MKTKLFSIAILGLLSVGMLFQSCNSDNESEASSDKVISQNYKDRLIDSKTAQALGDTYLTNNYAVLLGGRTARGLSAEDARQVIYPIEILEAFIASVEEKAGQDALIGVNIGQYPSSEIVDAHQREDYKGYQTMYLMSYKTPADTVSAANCVEAMNHGSIIPPDATADKNDILDKNINNYLIANETASLLDKTYALNNEKTLDAKGIEVKRQYFYSIGLLKGYLQYVKEQAVINGISDVNIAINMGQNSFSSGAVNKGKQKAGSQCIFFTAFPKGNDANSKNLNILNNLPALK
ncbi:hypothetical protein [Chryseobacterium proteolyticum]|uniref:hypothetical protein n=1 Tax=Chryseobacterium proteolyticum TaxID=118127 RepID=UPI00398319C5